MNIKKSVLVYLTLLTACASSAQAEPTHEWYQELGTGNDTASYRAAADGLGNVYIAGGTGGRLPRAVGGAGEAFLAKYDANGSLQWTWQPDTDDLNSAIAVSADGAGYVYIVGSAGAFGARDSFLTKLDDSGTPLWTQQFGTNENDYSNDVFSDGLGSVYISGSTEGSLSGGANAGDKDAFVAKFNDSGALQWARQLGTWTKDSGSGVAGDGLGNVYVTGTTEGSLEGANVGGSDAFIAKYDASGALQWTKQFGATDLDSSADVSVDVLGNVFVAGYTRGNLWGTSAGGLDAFLGNFDANGTLLWGQQFGTSRGEFTHDLSTDGLGHIYISGTTSGDLGRPVVGDDDSFVTKFSSDGTLLWTEQFGDGFWEQAMGVSADNLGNVFVSGWSLPTRFSSNSNAFVAKFSDLPELAGDFNGDGICDGADFLAWQRGESADSLSVDDLSDWQANFGTRLGDFDGDLSVDGGDFLAWQRGASPDALSPIDLAVWQAHFAGGDSTNAQRHAAAPEPAAVILASLGLLAFSCCRSRLERNVFGGQTIQRRLR